MKKIIVLLLSVFTVFAFCIPAFAAEPVEGSWMINEVFEIDADGNSVLKTRDEAQSLYGSGISILTFFDGGYASEIVFNAGDMYDASAAWTATDTGYEFMEDGLVLSFTYDADTDSLHRGFTDDNEEATYKDLDFVYVRAVVGSWMLHDVIQINEGDAPTELPEEENQSLYGNKDNVLTFNADRTAVEKVIDGNDAADVSGTWEMTEPDLFVLTQETGTTQFNYFRVDDTLYYDINDGERTLRFTYARVDEADEEMSPEDELIAGGQIFTGIEQTVYDPETKAEVVLKELNQGGWANEATGVTYLQGTDGNLYRDDGSVLTVK